MAQQPDTKNIEVQFKCEDCGHIQTVYGFIYDGRRYFGSGADFCDKCDGLPIEIKEDLLTQLNNPV